jgi:lipopolysaccharide transport system ATP-binding protein
MITADTAIKVENISKCYRIGLKEKVHDSLSGAMLEFIRGPLNNYRKYRSLYKFEDLKAGSGGNSSGNPADIIWALNGVTFQVKRGEVIGIIGRNGAGKSTLLKILTRITDPTGGRAEIRGRVSSLLEVGTGFHQELTGRENVYLNGTVLGMTKKEVDRKFDEIVDFSGVEKFIDTPVKRYSSGMNVRLAFAVAAHLEPEILLVDEVLAVGDASFQRKCLNKMQDVGQRGRAVLFVSHNMPAIATLCERAILLDEGKIVEDGPSQHVVASYLSFGRSSTATKEWPDPENAPSGEVARLRAVRVRTEEGETTDVFDIRRPVGIEMEYEVLKPGYVLLPHHILFNEEGVQVFKTLDSDTSWRGRARQVGRYISTAWIPGNLLSRGMFFVHTAAITLGPNLKQFHERDVVAFQTIDNFSGDSARGDYGGRMYGIVRPLLKWTTQFYSNDDKKAPDVTE